MDFCVILDDIIYLVGQREAGYVIQTTTSMSA